MKRLTIILFLFLGVAAIAATADTNNSVASQVTSVAGVKKADLETRAVLDGKIVRKVADGEYIFSDGTGEIRLQVMDSDQVAKCAANPNNHVHVVGHVAQDMLMTQVTADLISIQD